VASTLPFAEAVESALSQPRGGAFIDILGPRRYKRETTDDRGAGESPENLGRTL
jgi:hypothetical protein